VQPRFGPWTAARYDRTVIRIDSGRGQLGEALPDLTLPTLDGTPFALNSLRGRRFLLFFWGSW
jgi:hypothetical protein